MSDHTFVQGNTAPSIKERIYDTDAGSPKNLSDVTAIRFQMRRSDDKKHTVDAIASVVDAAAGDVQYDWQANDLSVPGDDYLGQWEMTFSDGKIQTTTPPTTITIERR